MEVIVWFHKLRTTLTLLAYAPVLGILGATRGSRRRFRLWLLRLRALSTQGLKLRTFPRRLLLPLALGLLCAQGLKLGALFIAQGLCLVGHATSLRQAPLWAH